jgi:hypothetical protein
MLPHLAHLSLPPFHRVRQDFPGAALPDVAGAVRDQLRAIDGQLKPGRRCAIAVGSRGIADLALLVGTLIAGLKARGVLPFIVPAMGSHGGATAEGQAAVLAGYGISEATMGVPVRSSMATRRVAGLRWAGDGYQALEGPAADALELHLDATALEEADLIIPVVRVKPHTGFRGRYESGICKMLAIGLGKHETCARLHREGYGRFDRLIPAAGAAILATGRITAALAVVENAAERVAHVELVPAAAIMAREPELLEQARGLMARLLLPAIDVLVIDEIGKDISGTGMDPNITGRSELGPTPGFSGPAIARIVVLGLSARSAGNASGLGLADVITERCFAAIDRAATAINVLTAGSLRGGRIPVAVAGDEQAVLAAAACVPGRTVGEARIVRIRNTLELLEIAVSESLLPEVAGHPSLTLLGPFAGWS